MATDTTPTDLATVVRMARDGTLPGGFGRSMYERRPACRVGDLIRFANPFDVERVRVAGFPAWAVVTYTDGVTVLGQYLPQALAEMAEMAEMAR